MIRLLWLSIVILQFIFWGIFFTSHAFIDTRLYKRHLDYAQRFYSVGEVSRACVEIEEAMDFAIMGDVTQNDLANVQELRKEYCGAIHG